MAPVLVSVLPALQAEPPEVLNLAVADIEDTPDFGDGTATPYVLGMAKVKGKVKILLEIDRVLATTDLRAPNTLVQ